MGHAAIGLAHDAGEFPLISGAQGSNKGAALRKPISIRLVVGAPGAIETAPIPGERFITH